jgi:hypothetical protein
MEDGGAKRRNDEDLKGLVEQQSCANLSGGPQLIAGIAVR